LRVVGWVSITLNFLSWYAGLFQLPTG
jgi:hypothetical protein